MTGLLIIAGIAAVVLAYRIGWRVGVRDAGRWLEWKLGPALKLLEETADLVEAVEAKTARERKAAPWN